MSGRWTGVTNRWPGRSERVAQFIDPGESVIDLGAGAQALGEFLPHGCRYYPVDLPLFDMDKGAWPEGRFDVATMIGVLEYSKDPGTVLRRLRALAPRALITYAHGGRLRDPDWNDLSVAWFIELAVKAGWKDVRRVDVWRAPGLRRQRIWELR